MSMDNRALMYRWFEEIWNKGREEVIDEMCAPDGELHGLAEGSRRLKGPSAFRQFYCPFRNAFPDLKVTVEDVLVDGDQAAARLTATGTHTGDGIGIPATGKPVTFTAMVWGRWRDGQMVEGWNELDVADVLAQLANRSDPVDMGETTCRAAVKAR